MSGIKSDSLGPVAEGTTKSTVVNHYPGPGEAISWTYEEEGKKECEEGKATQWTRNIPGIDGALSATQHNNEAAVLQLHDLEGNVVATAAVSETEAKLLTTYNPTEFGVPVNGTPPTKFSWLGASGLATETSTGAANPGGGSYVPQLGRPLQTEPVTPPGAPDGTYISPYIGSAGSAADYAGDAAYAAGAPEREASRLAAAKKAQEEEEEEEEAQARARAEPESQMNAPTPAEGGAEESREVDPAIRLMTRQAEVLAAGLRKGPQEVEALAWSGIIGDFTIEMAELVVQVRRDYMDGMAYGLGLCVEDIHDASKTRVGHQESTRSGWSN
jgi:hypothetical protein